MVSRDFAFFQHGLDAFDHDVDRARAHRRHRLAYCGERRGTKSRRRNIVESDYRAVLRNSEASLAQGADGAEGGHVVEGKDRRKLALLLQQILSEFLPRFQNWREDRATLANRR